MNNFKSVINHGELDPTQVNLQVINEYTNENKKCLHRFSFKKNPAASYVFKPTNTAVEVDQELWMQEHFKALIPAVTTPAILDYCIDEGKQEYWMVLEDAGTLTHTYSEDILIEAARTVVNWHKLPPSIEIKHTKAFLPYIDEALITIIENEALYRDLLVHMGVHKRQIDVLYEHLSSLHGVFPTEQTVSHGDFLFINLASKNGRFIVLDWEFLQINSVYFDLFTLIDMAVVRYRIKPNKHIRMKVLQAYIQEREKTGWQAPAHFIKNYHLYVLIYSVLTLKWLFSDLETGKFDRDLLLKEKDELTAIISDCLEYIAEGP